MQTGGTVGRGKNDRFFPRYAPDANIQKTADDGADDADNDRPRDNRGYSPLDLKLFFYRMIQYVMPG